MQRDMRGLLAHAGESFDTVRLECVAEYHVAALQRASERSIPDLAARLAEGSVARIDAPGARPRTGDADQQFRHDWHVWWRKPSCWRDDMVWANGTTVVCTACGASASWYMSQLATFRTNQPHGRTRERLSGRVRSALAGRRGPGVPGYPLPTVAGRLAAFPLVDPPFLADGWELTALGEGQQAGRAAVRVRARRLGAESPPGFWESVDQYDVLVDRERGVLLRYAGIVDGEEAGVFAVRAVAFDEAIPDDVFSYQPPAGTTTLSA